MNNLYKDISKEKYLTNEMIKNLKKERERKVRLLYEKSLRQKTQETKNKVKFSNLVKLKYNSVLKNSKFCKDKIIQKNNFLKEDKKFDYIKYEMTKFYEKEKNMNILRFFKNHMIKKKLQNKKNFPKISDKKIKEKNFLRFSYKKKKKNDVMQKNSKTVEKKDIKIKISKTEKKIKIKKKIKLKKHRKHDYLYIGDLTPSNLEEEKKKFFQKNENYNPIFKYSKNPKKKLLKRKPHKKLLSLAILILKKTLIKYKTYKNLEKLGGHYITIKETKQYLDKYLKYLNLHKKITYKFLQDRISPTSVIHKKNGETEILIKLPIKYRRKTILDVLNHEIGTHCVRKHNDKKQIWHKNRRKFKLKGFLHIEEGLGSLNTLYERAKHKYEIPFLFKAALNYLSAYLASKLSFSELYQYLKKFIDCEEKIWTKCVRVKRGLEITENKGGMYKDQVYFIGAVEILSNRNRIDFKELYCGKICIEDCKKLGKKGFLKKDILLPYFLNDQEEYVKVLDYIARCNFID